MESVDRGLLKVAKRAELVRSARLVALAAAIPVAGFVVAGPGSSHDDDVFDLPEAHEADGGALVAFVPGPAKP